MLIKGKLGFFIVLIMAFAIIFAACDPDGGDEDLLPPSNYPPGEGPGYYAVGDTGPGGGIIIYYEEHGFELEGYGEVHYLEAAPEDLGRLVWFDGNWQFVPDASNLNAGIGTGRHNTILLHGLSEETEAATACINYRGGRFSDWFLPSKDELNILWENRSLLNLKSFNYWSSSSDPSSDNRSPIYMRYAINDFENHSWGQDFYAHPIRAF